MKDYSLAPLIRFTRQWSMGTNQTSQGKGNGSDAKAVSHFSFCKPWLWRDGKIELKCFIVVRVGLNTTWINKQNVHTLNTNFVPYSSEQCFHQVALPSGTIYLQGAVVINATLLPCMHSNLFYKWPHRNEWTYSRKRLLMTARVLQPRPRWNTAPSNKKPLVQRVKPLLTSDIFIFQRGNENHTYCASGGQKGPGGRKAGLCVNTWRYSCEVILLCFYELC